MKKASILLTLTLFSQVALAQGEGSMSSSGLMALAACFAISVAAFGGAFGQAKIGSSAMEGIARNPKARGDMFVPMIVGLVLIESLVLYAFVIAFMVVGKI